MIGIEKYPFIVTYESMNHKDNTEMTRMVLEISKRSLSFD